MVQMPGLKGFEANEGKNGHWAVLQKQSHLFFWVFTSRCPFPLSTKVFSLTLPQLIRAECACLSCGSEYITKY